MSLRRIKKNLGFLIAGAILFGVVVNVYMEINNNSSKEPVCLSTSTQ